MITEGKYQDSIPKWCYYQTVEQHKECLMLCWGLVAHIEEGKTITRDYCSSCEFYRGQGDCPHNEGNIGSHCNRCGEDIFNGHGD